MSSSSSNEALRQAQQAVIQQERLRALGQMASGIAHDINNAISPIALYTESLLEREPDLSERARDHLTTIQRAIDDVAQTVGAHARVLPAARTGAAAGRRANSIRSSSRWSTSRARAGAICRSDAAS